MAFTVGGCVSFLAGAALGLWTPLSSRFPVFAACCFLAIAAQFSRNSTRQRVCLLSAALFLLGVGRTLTAEKDFQTFRSFFPSGAEGVLRLRVDSDPELIFDRTAGGHETGRAPEGYLPPVQKIRCLVKVLAVDGRNVRPFAARATFRRSERYPGEILSYGQTLQARGSLGVPSPAMNPGGFDYALYLKSKNIPYAFQARPGSWRVTDSEGGIPLFRASLSLRRSVEDRVTALWPYPANALFLGLLLGEDAALQEELVEDFAVTGTVHILAVSGANTALVTGLLFLVFRVLGFRRKNSAWLSLFGLLLFVFMTGAPPSVCRAALWGGLILLAVICERAPRLGTLAILSAALLVAHNPFTLFDLSFQLSYLAALGLVTFGPWWYARLKGLWRPAAATLAATLGAQMGVWVLMADRFNQFAVYSIPANLAVAPLVAAATASGLLAMSVSFLAGGAAAPFVEAARLPLEILPATASWIASWPGASMVVATPPLKWVVVFHTMLFLSFTIFWPAEAPEKPSGTWTRRERIRILARRGCLACWILFLAFTCGGMILEKRASKPFRVVFLAVGHGNAVVLEDPSGRVMVVDGGRERDGPARWNPVVAYLRHKGWNRVEAILNTHPDADHVGGLVSVLEACSVGKAYQGKGARARSRVYQLFLKRLEEKRVPLIEAQRGFRLTELPGVETRVAHPPAGFRPRKHRENNRSVVLWTEAPCGPGKIAILLTGDMEPEAWEMFFRLERSLRPLEGLLAPHHGRKSGGSESAMEKLRPAWVVSSDLKPHPELAGRIFADDSDRVLSTADSGAVIFTVYPRGRWTVASFRRGIHWDSGALTPD